MSAIRIQETRNGGAQLSQGNIFLIANKFRINRGANTGHALITVKISRLENSRNTATQGVFTEYKSFLMTSKEFDNWIALLMQVSNRPLTEIKDGEPDANQKKL